MDFTVGIVSRNLATTLNFVEFRDSRNFTLFEALSIGCRKTTCDVTKVTYYMYSCDICCMSRERMEIDGLDSAKCQKSRKMTQVELMELLMNKTK